MVIFVDLEHKRLRLRPVLWRFLAAKTLESDTDTPLPEELLPPEQVPPLSTGAFERGFVPIHIAAHKPLFSGLSKKAYFINCMAGR